MNSLAYAALWIFIFALPWQNIIVIPGVGTISRLMGMIAFALLLLAAVLSGRLRRWRPFHLSALLFLLWAGWGLYRGEMRHVDDYEIMVHKFVTYVQLFLVLWMVWELAPTPRRQLGLLFAYVLGAYVAAVNTILVYRRAASTVRRFAAEGFDPNDLAMTLALAMPMAWYLGLMYRRTIWRWLCRGFLPVGLMALVLTGSRGGLIAGIVGLLIVPFTMVRFSPGRIAAAVLLLGGGGVIAVANAPDVVVQRLATTQDQFQEGGMNGRLRIWSAGVEALMQRPVFGHGTGGFERAVVPILGSRRGAHNSFLGVLVEQGVLGFLLYAAMFVTVFRQVLRLSFMERRFALVLLTTLGVAMLPLTWDDAKPVWFVLGFLIAFAESMRLRAGELPTEQQVPRPPVPTVGRPAPAWTRAGLAFPPR
jgi:O-antigen ligase